MRTFTTQHCRESCCQNSSLSRFSLQKSHRLHRHAARSIDRCCSASVASLAVAEAALRSYQHAQLRPPMGTSTPREETRVEACQCCRAGGQKSEPRPAGARWLRQRQRHAGRRPRCQRPFGRLSGPAETHSGDRPSPFTPACAPHPRSPPAAAHADRETHSVRPASPAFRLWRDAACSIFTLARLSRTARAPALDTLWRPGTGSPHTPFSVFFSWAARLETKPACWLSPRRSACCLDPRILARRGASDVCKPF